MLPPEMIAEIGLYLDLKDVLNCSLVSKAWRNGMNDNRIWRRLLYPRIDWTRRSRIKRVPSLQGVYDPILRHKCFVDPPFEVPKNAGEGLDKLCSWRIRFMQEKWIQYNFSHGRYTFERANEEFAEELNSWLGEYCQNRHRFDDDYFILHFHIANIFKVWRQTSSGEMYKLEPIKPALSDKEVIVFALTTNGFFYVQEHLLVYYTKNEEAFNLEMRVIVHEEPEFSRNIPPDDDLTDWYRNNIVKEDTFMGVYCDNKYFLAEFNINSYTQLHIWEFKSGLKQKRHIDLKMDILYNFHCQIATNGKLYFFYYFENRLMFDRVYSFDLNDPNSRMKTFLRVSGCNTPDFHRSKLIYLKVGKENYLKTCDLLTKKINSTVVDKNANCATLVSTFHIIVMKTPPENFSMDRIVTLYNIESLEPVTISINLSGAHFISPDIFYYFSDRLVIRSIKENQEVLINVKSVLFISDKKFIDMSSKVIYHFWYVVVFLLHLPLNLGCGAVIK